MTSQTSLLPAPVFSILILVALLMLPLTRAAEHSVPTDTWIPGWLVVVAALGALLVAALAAVVIGLRLCRLLLSPLDRVRLLGEVGYVEVDGRQPLKDVVELVRRRRCVGDVPPVYPNGWFALVESRCLGVGEVKNVFCVGEHCPPTGRFLSNTVRRCRHVEDKQQNRVNFSKGGPHGQSRPVTYISLTNLMLKLVRGLSLGNSIITPHGSTNVRTLCSKK